MFSVRLRTGGFCFMKGFPMGAKTKFAAQATPASGAAARAELAARVVGRLRHGVTARRSQAARGRPKPDKARIGNRLAYVVLCAPPYEE